MKRRNLYVGVELWERATKLAEKMRISVSEYTRRALTRQVELDERQANKGARDE